MTELTHFVTAMVALSMGVERIIEILKGMIPWINGRDIVVHALAAVCGALVALALGPDTFLNIAPKTQFGVYVDAGLLGLMASGGSAFWNNILDILHVVKTVKEQSVANSDAKPK